MAITTIKTDSRVIVQETEEEVTVTSIYRGVYACSDGGEYTASEIRLVKPVPKPLKKTPLKKPEITDTEIHRQPLKRSSKKIKQISDKRSKEIKEYSQKRIVFLNTHTECQAKLKNCSIMASEVHHMKGKENDLLLDEQFWLPVCTHCHIIITEQSRMAIDLGLSLSRHS